MATENQYYNKFTYKPYVDYQYCQSSYTTEAASPMMIAQQTNYATVNNDLAPSSSTSSSLSSSSSSSSLLSPYPLASSMWQNSYPTDYLGLPTFDQQQQSSPTVSVLSSLSPSSVSSTSDMMIYSADDFCVSDLMDSQSQQTHMLSPMFTNTTPSNDSYYAQQQPMQQRQVSPRSEYWISPATPLMESMDGYMINGMDQQQSGGCFFIKQEDEGSMFMSTTTPPFNIEMTTPMTGNNNNNNNNNNKPTSGSSVLGTIKKKTKKIHQCPHCNHTSNRANNMKEHILTHDPHRPKLFACNTCQKSFARKHDMKRHAKSHLKVPRRQIKSATQKQQKA